MRCSRIKGCRVWCVVYYYVARHLLWPRVLHRATVPSGRTRYRSAYIHDVARRPDPARGRARWAGLRRDDMRRQREPRGARTQETPTELACSLALR